MKKDIKNIEASVKAQLKNKAKQMNIPFAEVLQYYGMERFLYRLSKSKYVDKFILKGALMFNVWGLSERRITLDIDFLAHYDNRIVSIEKVIKSVCKTIVIPDGLFFDPENVKGQLIKEDADYEGVRIKFLGMLERSRIPIQIDLGFGDIIYPKAQEIKYPAILDFPQPEFKGYPRESVVSEKFEAIIKLGLLNSRMKDFYDIWLMMRKFKFHGSKLVEALRRTFAHRKTLFPEKLSLFAEEIYDEKSDRQILWKAFLIKNEIQHVPEKLFIVAKNIETFLIQPIESIIKEEKFNKIWEASGCWK